MDENGAQESSMDFYAQFNSLKALEKKFWNLTTGFPWLYRVLQADPARFGNQAYSAGRTLYGQGKPVGIFQKFLLQCFKTVKQKSAVPSLDFTISKIYISNLLCILLLRSLSSLVSTLKNFALKTWMVIEIFDYIKTDFAI